MMGGRRCAVWEGCWWGVGLGVVDVARRMMMMMMMMTRTRTKMETMKKDPCAVVVAAVVAAVGGGGVYNGILRPECALVEMPPCLLR